MLPFLVHTVHDLRLHPPLHIIFLSAIRQCPDTVMLTTDKSQQEFHDSSTTSTLERYAIIQHSDRLMYKQVHRCHMMITLSAPCCKETTPIFTINPPYLCSKHMLHHTLPLVCKATCIIRPLNLAKGCSY